MLKHLALLAALFAAPAVYAQAAVPAGSIPITQTATRHDASACVSASGTAQQTITISAAVNQFAYITWISSTAWATTAPVASSVTTTATNLGMTSLAAF